MSENVPNPESNFFVPNCNFQVSPDVTAEDLPALLQVMENAANFTKQMLGETFEMKTPAPGHYQFEFTQEGQEEQLLFFLQRLGYFTEQEGPVGSLNTLINIYDSPTKDTLLFTLRRRDIDDEATPVIEPTEN